MQYKLDPMNKLIVFPALDSVRVEEKQTHDVEMNKHIGDS